MAHAFFARRVFLRMPLMLLHGILLADIHFYTPWSTLFTHLCFRCPPATFSTTNILAFSLKNVDTEELCSHPRGCAHRTSRLCPLARRPLTASVTQILLGLMQITFGIACTIRACVFFPSPNHSRVTVALHPPQIPAQRLHEVPLLHLGCYYVARCVPLPALLAAASSDSD